MPGDSAAVVTVVSGRHEHLAVQRHHLMRSTRPPLVHVVVAIDDAAIHEVVDREPGQASVVLSLPTTAGGLPVAAARNAGVAAALAAGADTVVLLDVDCLPAPELLARYDAALGANPTAVICGPVTYLPPASARGWGVDDPTALRHPHEARPDPVPGEVEPLAPELFWSLSFALTAGTWHRLGGFYEGYVGYGAEDTDFGAHAAATGTPLLMAGGADAYHQHHAVSRPPIEHVDDIVRNSAVYLRRQGALPMQGWLDEFAARGLVETAPSGAPRRTDAPRVLTVPARHPYLDAVLPDSVVRVAPDRVAGWEPDPVLPPGAVPDGVDVVHLHFGYDHVEPDDLGAWLRDLEQRGIALVLTVHDLRNPHHADRVRHDRHLALLVAAADRVLTLTDAAAAECAQRFGRRPEVAPHPTLLTADEVRRARTANGPEAPFVLVPLKALRRNVVDPADVVAAVRDAAAVSGVRTRVLLQPSHADAPAVAPVVAAAARGELDLDVRNYLPADELHALVAAAHAVVLPYRFGTHSGWAELARDVGTYVIAPDGGHVAGQWDQVASYVHNETLGLDRDDLVRVVGEVCARPAAEPADRTGREVERDLVRAAHDVLYRAVGRPR